MKLAVVGTGIAGLTAAWKLQGEHDLTVYEAADRMGGHTNTVDVLFGGRRFGVDTGFIVYNTRTYPNFVRMLGQLGVPTQPTEMSFSVSCGQTGLEYSSQALFARWRNLVSPRYLELLREIVRFFRVGNAYLDGTAAQPETLQTFLDRHRFSHVMRRYYLAPMLAAIWSADPAEVFDFPARHFLAFFRNHGLLQANGGARWRVISGGSSRYTEKLTAGFRDNIRLKAPVEAVWRAHGHVWVKTPGDVPEPYDHVIIAAHSDEALRMLASPTRTEQAVLGAIPYKRNEVVLHTDTRLLPRDSRVWASWNVRVPKDSQGAVTMTYDMNRLQRLHDAPETFCVTLNSTPEIDPHRVIRTFSYSHPVFSQAALDAQARHHEISGAGIHYCGAYWGYGFHEDGVVSALRVCDAIRESSLEQPAREPAHA